jgi:hypothetical protein
MNRSRVRLVASAAWRVGSTAIVAVAIIAALAFLAIAWDASRYLVDDGVVTAHQRSRTSDGTVLLRYVVRGD